MDEIVARLERTLGCPGLVSKLATELSASDLQSLLMAVYDRRAQDRSPAAVLRDHAHNRFTRPSPIDPRRFARIDRAAHRLLADASFRLLDLAPLSAWGSCSALATVSQNKVVSALRGEVSADPTNTLALEASLVRRRLLAADARSEEPARLAAHQRVTRTPMPSSVHHFAHFRVYGLVTAGRDPGDRRFDRTALIEHLGFHVALILETAVLEPATVRIALTPLGEEPGGTRMERWMEEEIRPSLPVGVGVELDTERESGRGYYERFCFKIHVEHPDIGLLEISDGGCVGWTRELLSSRKERCFISGSGVDRLAKMLSYTTFAAISILLLALGSSTDASAQAFLEYPGHSATYGDHTVNTSWTNGPTTVLLTFDSDESILHEDGNGQSQRTARNTLTHNPPSDPGNPQNYDDLSLIGVYGERLPLLQQMSANGTSTLGFEFDEPVSSGFDLFLTDLDTADELIVRAFGPGEVPIDMTRWSLRSEGDLSLYKDTGTGYSDVVAPTPFVTFLPDRIEVSAADSTNYNRSYSILRAPETTIVSRLEVEFTGIQNSSSRAAGGTGSHVYVGLSTIPETSGVGPSTQPGRSSRDDGHAPRLALISANPNGAGPLRFEVRLERPARVEIALFDSGGRCVSSRVVASLEAGTRELRLVPPGHLATGVYRARLRTSDGGTASVNWVHGP